ncbi:MAG: polymer-forming cytoskeletal protein [Alphaproteobacteria bacterium]|nr:polymer-forming cytoskeletal protein [Alphaproteobacteria bacterium]
MMAKFEKNTDKNNVSESVIGSEMEIFGDIKCNGIMRVVGKVKGTINCSELIVEQNAYIKGNISAGSVSIDGDVTGVVKTKAIEISSNASFAGEVFYARIAIDSGANLEAKLNHDPAGEKARQNTKMKPTESENKQVKSESQPKDPISPNG